LDDLQRKLEKINVYLEGEKVGQDLVGKHHLISKAFDNQVAMSAHVNGDNRGERKV